jgi:hypothetical protein
VSRTSTSQFTLQSLLILVIVVALICGCVKLAGALTLIPVVYGVIWFVLFWVMNKRYGSVGMAVGASALVMMLIVLTLAAAKMFIPAIL